jgi:hypothetical protein
LVLTVAAVYAGVALAAVSVNLHGPHVGASSMTFQGGSDEAVESVLWHFVLNGLEKDSTPGTITVVFGDAGSKTATAYKVSGGVQHFNVTTPGHDTLLGASAVVESETADGLKLLLSHVVVTAQPTPPGDDDGETTPPGDDDGETPPPGDDDGETPPPGDDDGETTPPGDDDGETTPPGDDDGETTPPGDDDETTTPTSENDDAEPFLPFTGGELFTLLASGFVAAGLGLSLRERASRIAEDEDTE